MSWSNDENPWSGTSLKSYLARLTKDWRSMEADSGGRVPEVGTPEWTEIACAVEAYAFAPQCPEEKFTLWLGLMYQGWGLHKKEYIKQEAIEAYSQYLHSLGLP